MNTETAGIAAKAIATAGAAVAVFGLTWWALVAALIGAAASYHFEPEQVPSKASRLVFGIVAMGFAAALAAVAFPHFGRGQEACRRSHKPEIPGSTPGPATNSGPFV